MTSLYRCRTSLAETSQHFGAGPARLALWSAELRPGRLGLVIAAADGGREIRIMRWGLPASLFPARGRPDRGRTTLWAREISERAPFLWEPEHRCILVADSFALPEGRPGERTRCWFGLEDEPLFGWAGIWIETPDGPAYAGLNVASGDPMLANSALPALLQPHEYDEWLFGNPSQVWLLARRANLGTGLYREPTEEPWGADRDP